MPADQPENPPPSAPFVGKAMVPLVLTGAFMFSFVLVTVLIPAPDLPEATSLRPTIGLANPIPTGLRKSADQTAAGHLNAELLAMSLQPSLVEHGTVLFAQHCASCHAPDATSNALASNMFDGTWVHGSRPESILLNIQNGMPDLDMPAYNEILSSDEMAALVAFILHQEKLTLPEPAR